MHTYIYTVYIYILYIYIKYSCKLKFAVSQTQQKANFTPSPLSFSLQWWDVLLGILFPFLLSTKFSLSSTEQLIEQLLENRSCFHSRALNKWETLRMSLRLEAELWWNAGPSWSIMGITLRERRKSHLAICPFSTQQESERHMFIGILKGLSKLQKRQLFYFLIFWNKG